MLSSSEQVRGRGLYDHCDGPVTAVAVCISQTCGCMSAEVHAR